MRLVLAVFLVALSSSLALAQGARPKVSLRVVEIMPGSHQALLLDKARGTRLLAEVGATFEGFRVEDIDDDQVTLASSSGTELVLSAPRATATIRSVEAPTIRTVEAPGAIRTIEAPGAQPVIRSVEAPTAIAAPVTTSENRTVEDPPAVLGRAEVTAALGNFARLASSIRGELTPGGLRIDSLLDGSLFARGGLRAGDLVESVDHQPLRSLDDAAALYARADATRSLSLQIVRGGKPVSLRVVIE